MKVAAVLLCLFALNASAAKENPIARVARLMQNLSEQIDKDEEKEQKLFDQFMCWGETTVSSKTQSNSEANSRIQSLEAYVSDLDAGKVELTDERVTLEAELKKLNNELKNMETTRETDHKDFKDAESEMKKALTAMDKAIDVLGVATKGHEEGVLMQNSAQEAQTFEAQQSQAATLTYAADLGDKFLDQKDALFLRRVLTGDVPHVDWKKVNRKANFKKSYKARSFGIQKTLDKMRLTFSRNLDDAVQKEKDSQAEFDQLHEAKTEQRDKTQTAYENMDGENGARAESRQESMDEVNALKTQVDNDTKFIAQLEDEMQVKRTEWGERMKLRAGEKEALAKAIAVIRSDDAKDLFKKSLASDDEVFLQVSQHSSLRMSRKSAAELLRSVADKAGDKRLATLASSIASAGKHFTEVIKSIDEMITVLKEEEESDLNDKENCEKTRKSDTREAALDARHIDDLSDNISKLQAEIADLKEQIASNKASKKNTEDELAHATEMRKEQHAEWQSNDQDDGNAANLVAESRKVLSAYYEENGMFSLAQTNKAAPETYKPEVSAAGEAPMPPPSTWEQPYGGKAAESQGIVAIMETIEQDIRKDQAKAKAEEDAAQQDYNKMKKESLDEIQALATAISELESNVAGRQRDIKEAKQEQMDTKESLDAVLKKMRDLKGGCDFVTINYKMRLENRHMEMDGLMKAKAILNGAVFDAPDKNREMKPGDALLSIRRH